MSISKVLSSLDFEISKEEEKRIKGETEMLVGALRGEIKKKKIPAEIFVGGSFAKGSLIKKNKYDVDIFARFDWRYENISKELEKILKGLKIKAKKIHGSRDYYRIEKGKEVFEIVPVTKIKHPKEMRNVTDLSFFHVNYVKKKFAKNKKLGREIAFAKKFFEAQKVYGAESYVHGFSGYGLECLIIYYGSFEKMLRALVKAKFGERIVIDIEKRYKRKADVYLDINESKLHSPIILVDPTWKERNVLAALSQETFERFQKAALGFLKKPRKEYFELEEIDSEDFKKEAKKKKAEFVEVILGTDRQEGDIAGSKLKKFSDFVIIEISKSFEVLKKEFEYSGKKSGGLFLVVKPKKEIVRIGPPLEMKKHVSAFKKKNKNTYVKNGILHAKIKVNQNAKKFLSDFKKLMKGKIKEMGIVDLRIG